ncbi:peptidoglycan editing factor PgeF [Sporolactobacillus spathodeae]|uniref:Purine nucleoside phosphorylase n=1 Tax=Sporolactobacillus spathodeae TaxID=1465502 RepID=A0ABS2QAB4_9BACL|nr:YfiH family protein [Sporolactobacillus spathodeae]
MKDVFSLRKKTAVYGAPVQAAGNQTIMAGFSLRTGGKSKPPWSTLNLGLHVGDIPEDVIANRSVLADSIGFPLERWICAEQIHGTEIAVVTETQVGSGAKELETVVKGADGLMTTSPDVLLALCFADCVPVYFYVEDPAAIAILHAGWRGTVGQGARKMVDLLVEQLHLSSAKKIHAIIGPAIGQQDYEVDDRVFREVTKLKPKLWNQAVTKTENGHYLLGLKELNRAILLDSGLSSAQIEMTDYTTYQCPELFFSYRRDQGCTGRMIGFIGLKAEGESAQ